MTRLKLLLGLLCAAALLTAGLLISGPTPAEANNGADVTVHKDGGGCFIAPPDFTFTGQLTSVQLPNGKCNFQCNVEQVAGAPLEEVVKFDLGDKCKIVLTPGGTGSWTCHDAILC